MAHPERGRLRMLAAGERAAYLLLALPDAALRRICRDLGLTFPGYRLEKVPGGEIARTLAEDYDLHPRVADLVDGRLDEACRVPLAVPAGPIRPGMVRLMTVLAASPPPVTVPLLWQLFGHPVETVRRAGVRALDDYLGIIHGLGDEAGDPLGAQGGSPRSPAGDRSGSRSEIRARLKAAEARAAELARDLEALRRQLAGERREVALRDEKLAQARADLAETERRLRTSEESRAVLEAERDRDAAAEARHHMAEAARRAREIETLQAELVGARRREAELLSRLKQAESAPAPVAAPPRKECPAEPAMPFQVPVFSAEFYDSIHHWDARIVRAAFEKALLLSQNLAHPGLDAKPMEGAEGLYRIRVAQDVRLFYRRLPAGRLEILSLIDREDLDRYVHRYRSRVSA